KSLGLFFAAVRNRLNNTPGVPGAGHLPRSGSTRLGPGIKTLHLVLAAVGLAASAGASATSTTTHLALLPSLPLGLLLVSVLGTLTLSVMQFLVHAYASYTERRLQDKLLHNQALEVGQKLVSDAEIRGLLEHVQQNWKAPVRLLPSLA